jgi:hypothetical protein
LNEEEMFENRQVEEVVRIAAAGGGFRVDASLKQTNDLVRIASAAATKGARIVFAGLENRQTEELVRIAAAGEGCVFFENKK